MSEYKKEEMQKEIKLGEETIVGGKTVVCVESDGSCHSKKEGKVCIHWNGECSNIPCVPDNRTDEKYICFIEKENT